MATQSNLSILEELKNAINALIELFDETISVINQQNSAVIAQDLDKINAFAEQQMELNQIIQEKENHFQEKLSEAYEQLNLEDSQKSLTLLLNHIKDPETKKHFQNLRDKLVSGIKEAQKAQLHLNELLLFAQEHVNDTLRAIYSFGNQSSLHYNKSGKKNQTKTSLINKTA